jgi:hypothetical protein
MCFYILPEIKLSVGKGWEMGSQIGKHQQKSLEVLNWNNSVLFAMQCQRLKTILMCNWLVIVHDEIIKDQQLHIYLTENHERSFFLKEKDEVLMPYSYFLLGRGNISVKICSDNSHM